MAEAEPALMEPLSPVAEAEPLSPVASERARRSVRSLLSDMADVTHGRSRM